MKPSRDEVLARERRWALPVALATLAAVGLIVAYRVVIGSVGGDGDAEVLRSIDENRATVVLAGIMQGLGFLLLAAPLVYLFRAAQARSERVRGQLIGLVIVTPLFLAASALLGTSLAAPQAASDFAAGEASAGISREEAAEDCRSERDDDAESFGEEFGGEDPLGECVGARLADSRAEEAFAEAPTHSIALGFGLAGRLGLAFALLYSCLWAMRVGLLTRFWGSLGMAMGAAALLLLIELPMIWFLYFALLVGDWIPGDRPPAWESGEAEPWPTPGEKAAERLGSEEDEAADRD